jgi:signal transduction histidine kinase
MIRLVNELLMLAHADAGRSLAKEKIRINPVIEEVVRQSKQIDQNRQVTLVISGNPVILGDRDALKQIVLIILDNAIKYSQKEVMVTSRVDGQQVMLSIQDQGQGIPEEDLTKIFERFYRGEENSVIQGFGLGLPIAKSLIEAMNGSIAIESQLGRGSTVSVSFPIYGENPKKNIIQTVKV